MISYNDRHTVGVEIILRDGTESTQLGVRGLLWMRGLRETNRPLTAMAERQKEMDGI